jgi:hypothetical protein
MKQQIRTGVFETNSSSEHSLAVVAHDDYERWKKGELVARELGRKESPDPAGNFWSYIHEIEFAPAEKKDELNIKLIQENYKHFLDPTCDWAPYKSPEKLIDWYKAGKLTGNMYLFVEYAYFVKHGFDGCGGYVEHFSHDVPGGLKVFGTYYHS